LALPFLRLSSICALPSAVVDAFAIHALLIQGLPGPRKFFEVQTVAWTLTPNRAHRT
jgi:hypothetical protein